MEVFGLREFLENADRAEGSTRRGPPVHGPTVIRADKQIFQISFKYTG